MQRRSIREKFVTNLILGVLVVCIGALSLTPVEHEIVSEMENEKLYRSAGENAVGVSLMFNVYWGTEEVYRILETLSKYDAKASFFIGGCWADDNVDCLRAIDSAGHEIGNHGYFHKSHDTLNFIENQKEAGCSCRF